MHENIDLRLRVDPPYEGESISSFLDRTAQFYAISRRVLLRQLIGTQSLFGPGPRDLDLNPSPYLEQRLSETVLSWESPLVSHDGFNGPTVLTGYRYAYCPRCFLADIEAARTPHFRLDWSAFFVTTCWKHGTLLMPWLDTAPNGLRVLPKAWLYQAASFASSPAFFLKHLRTLDSFENGRTTIFGSSANEVVGRLRLFQSVIEKPAAETRPLFPRGADPKLRLRTLANETIHACLTMLWGSPPIDRYKVLIEPESFELLPIPAKVLGNGCIGLTRRRVADLNWRRTFCWVTAMTLAGTLEFGVLLTPEGNPMPWADWWSTKLVPLAGKSHRARFKAAADRLSRRLDGLDWPGKSVPDLEARMQRSLYTFGRKPTKNKPVVGPMSIH